MEDNSKIKLSSRNSAERNRAVKEKAVWNSPEMKEFRESIKQRFNVDIKDQEKLPSGSADFNWGAFRKKCMRETNGVSMNAQLLRAGIQAGVNNLYSDVKTTYEEWAHVMASARATELYAPLNSLSFLGETGEGEKYLESSVLGLDIKLNNKKFGQMLPISKELLEDDQTGQMAQVVQEMAQYAALLWEVYAYGKLGSVSGGCTYGGLVVPASETKPSYESAYPFAASPGLKGGGINKATAAVLSQANLQNAFIAMSNMLNMQGLKTGVTPDTIIASPLYQFTLASLLNSNFYPSGAQSAGVVGGNMSINPLQGIAKPVISRFVFDNAGACVNSKAWYVVDSSKPAFIVQLREAAKIEQEAPGSGAEFERDISRWKVSCRGNADFIDPRFFYQGSDGSV